MCVSVKYLESESLESLSLLSDDDKMPTSFEFSRNLCQKEKDKHFTHANTHSGERGEERGAGATSSVKITFAPCAVADACPSPLVADASRIGRCSAYCSPHGCWRCGWSGAFDCWPMACWRTWMACWPTEN